MGKPKILIIDDERDYTELLKKQLEAGGYDVVTALDGEAGLKTARTEDPPPDLILLDLIMPQIDGLKVLSSLKNSIETKYIPVIVLTIRGDTASINEAQAFGVKDYIVKASSSSERLLDLIRKYV